MSDVTAIIIDVRRAWPWFAIRGVMALLFGLFALIVPSLTALGLALLFGVYVLVDGIGRLADSFQNTDRSQRGLRILGGVLGVAAGVVAIVWLEITVAVLIIVIGVWALIAGIAEIAAAVRLRKQIRGEWLLGLAGVLSVVFGILIMFWPEQGAAAIATVIGVFALIYGVVVLALALRLRALSRA